MLVRVVGLAVARVAKRYPIVAVVFAVWRWWNRRNARTERTVVRLRDGETVSISARRERGI
jgi:hypothetical protein